MTSARNPTGCGTSADGHESIGAVMLGQWIARASLAMMSKVLSLCAIHVGDLDWAVNVFFRIRLRAPTILVAALTCWPRTWGRTRWCWLRTVEVPGRTGSPTGISTDAVLSGATLARETVTLGLPGVGAFNLHPKTPPTRTETRSRRACSEDFEPQQLGEAGLAPLARHFGTP